MIPWNHITNLKKLRNATLNSLRVAEENKLKSVAFPAISIGIFGFQLGRCAHIMLSTTIEYLKGKTNIKQVVFCLFGKESLETFLNGFETQI